MNQEEKSPKDKAVEKIRKETNTKYHKRIPIVMSKNSVALIHIFERHDHLEDIWMMDTEYMLETYDRYEGAANQFIEQLEEHWCDAFIKELTLKLVKTYKESRSRTGSDEDFKKLLENINKI